MILLIDHDDSFVYTLASYVAELGAAAEVVRAGESSVEAIAAASPDRVILSPGPGRPEQWPTTLEIIQAFGRNIPILGVCLGHQAIAVAYGAAVERSPHPRHGTASTIRHDGMGVFRNLPSPFRAARYHSLAIDPSTVPACLTVTARSDDGCIMGIRHQSHPVEGVQFHPESVLTERGHQVLANFLAPTRTERGTTASRSPLCFEPCDSLAPESSRCSR